MQIISTITINILIFVSILGGGLWFPGGVPPEGSNGTWENVEDVITPKGACIRARFVDNYDGDTITVHIMGWPWLEERVRLIGVDTPEKGEGEAAERATRFTRNVLANKTVYLEFDTRLRDKYNRLLAYVWLEDKAEAPRMLNLLLLREGLAEVLVIEPDDRYEDMLKKVFKKKGCEFSHI
jgi:micrococcal nuclease